MAETCTHLDQIRDVRPNTNGCEECLKTGDTWLHLRLCLNCGHVGCCDQSKGKHATNHFHATQHPLIRSLERREDWMWCFIDDVLSNRPGRRRSHLASRVLARPAGNNQSTRVH